MFTVEDHRHFFAEFCVWELKSGGPDSQLPTVAEMAVVDMPEEAEQLWRAFCYIGVYNVPYGEIMWKHWSLAEAEHNPAALTQWLEQAYTDKKIITRMERRAARRAFQIDGYLAGARRFIRDDWLALRARCASLDPHDAYEVVWTRVNKIPTVGRYAAIKLIEYLRRFHLLPVVTPDIRPKDAWSPRHTLGYIFPDRNLGNEDNSSAALKHAHASCVDAIDLLKSEFNVDIDMFQLQVLLCEYRESWEKKKQYPGRSLDSELGYARKAEEQWGHNSDIWRARSKLFPHHHLGEMRGWDKPRETVAECLNRHHYTWTDMLYDFKSTTDMKNPVKWP